MKSAFLEIFSYSFKLSSCTITFVLLPLSLIYNVNALLAMSYPFSIVCDLSIVQLTLILLSFVASAVLGLLSLSTYSLLKNSGEKIFFKLINAAAIIVIVGYTARYFRFWVVEIFKIQYFSISTGIPLTIIVFSTIVLFVLFNRYASSEGFNKLLDKLFICFIATVIIGSGMLSIKATNYIIIEGNHTNLENRNVPMKSNTGNQAIHPHEKGTAKNLPNIIMVTFDALAAEDMSLYGYQINTTPNIDAFAKESYVFNNMYANSNWTRPSTASIIIGKYPTTHKIFAVNHSTEKIPYQENLSGALRQKGYKTATVTSNFYTHPLQNMTFRDFDYLPGRIVNSAYLNPIEKISSLIPLNVNKITNILVLINDILFEANIIWNAYYVLFPHNPNETPYPPDLVYAKALNFILNADSPFFIWIHIMLPNGPYLPSEKFKYKLLKEKTVNGLKNILPTIKNGEAYIPEQQPIIDRLRLRYDENIMYADDEFGKFINKLSAKGFYEKSIFIVTSDHGKSFRKGYYGHKGGCTRLACLYQPTIRIPLIIHSPMQQNNKRIIGNAEHVDIAPTILDLLNFEVPRWMEGESLKKKMYYNHFTERPKYSITLSDNSANQPVLKGSIAVIKGDYKYIYQIDDNRGELYNINSDPSENINLVNTERQIDEELKKLITTKLYTTHAPVKR